MSDFPPNDPFLEAEVKRAMDRFRGKGIPEDLFAEMESMLRLAYLSDPVFQETLRDMRPRAAPLNSKRYLIADILGPAPEDTAASEHSAPARTSYTRLR